MQWTKQCYLIWEFSTFPLPKREGNEVGHELFDKSPGTRYQYRGYETREDVKEEKRVLRSIKKQKKALESYEKTF